MFKFVYDYVIAPGVSRTTETVSSVVSPVLNTTYDAGSAVLNWVRPLPAPDSTTTWKYGKYKLLISGEPESLLAFFKDKAQRDSLRNDHILSALHHPGLGLDLVVVYNLETIHENFIKRNYVDEMGPERNRLYQNICMMLKEDTDHYLPLIRNTLKNSNSLLYHAFHGQHSWSSYKPSELLVQLQTLLLDLEINRSLEKKKFHLSSSKIK